MESRGEKRITLNTLKRVFQQYLGFFYFSLGAVKLTFNEERKKERKSFKKQVQRNSIQWL